MPSAYHLLPVSFGVLLAYLFSYLMVRFELIKQKTHRKFWNSLLLLTFLVTGILGLLLVVQINYKLEWTLIDQFLRWHVNFGIAMALVALIHLLWHIDYYLKLFKRTVPLTSSYERSVAQPSQENKNQGPSILLTGFSTTIIQVLLIRELTTLFQGNEIMMTWTIALWMILTGTGSYLGSKSGVWKNHRLPLSTLLAWMGSLPLILILVLNLLKPLLFLPGVLINPWQYLLIVTILLAPVCLVSGILFTLYIKHGKQDPQYFIRVYSWEALGSVVGGLIVSFMLIQWFSIPESAVILALVVALTLFILNGKVIFIWLSAAEILLLLLFIIFPVENRIRSIALAGARVIESRESLEGNIMVTESGGEYNFFLNGALLFNTGNYIQAEEFVHYAMLQHPHPQEILLVSGGVSGMLREIVKYPDIQHIDYLEINRTLVQLAEKRQPLPDTTILELHPTDIHTFLRQADRKYDIVIMAVPDPSSVQLNRYYSDEFIGRLKDQLKENAVVIFGLAPSGNYMSPWQKSKLSLIFNTLQNHFKELTIIPGEKDYLLASDNSLSTAIATLCNATNLQNYYVNADYFDDTNMGLRSKGLLQQIDRNAGINNQDRALPVFYSSLKFLTLSHSALSYLLLPLLLLPLILLLLRKGARGMYLAGFTGASVEVMLIFMVQISLGYIYAVIGLLIALFMAGLVIGAQLGRKISATHRRYRIAFAGMILFLICLYGFLKLNYFNLPHSLIWFLFVLLMLFPSALAGYIFVASAELYPQENIPSAPKMYAIDLIGSALGMLVMTLVFIPVAGLQNSCLILIALLLIPVIPWKK